ncbi:MAG TPA: DUF2188 domain-containing protein [Xanthobacteraceae bacterium]|jgi:hypothetical protein|nr:DUF2188 domain-containing protein [Xanthobacteraceae bacterium]
MHQHRYIVVSEREGWKIVRGSPRPPVPYPTKREAVSAAMDFAARDGFAEAEVVVRQEDGYFATMWVHRGMETAADSEIGYRERSEER